MELNMISDLPGNAHVKTFLSQALETAAVPRTLLFHGPTSAPLLLFAEALAKALVGRAPSVDLRILVPEGKTGLHALETLREAIDASHTAPYEGLAKVFLICDAERMSLPSANALLKTLEEPAASSYFLLLSNRPDELLPTLLSRCSQVRLEGVGAMHMEQQQVLFALLRKRPPLPHLYASLEGLAAAEPEEGLSAKTYAEGLLTAFLGYCRDQEARRHGGTLLYPEEGPGEAFPLETALVRVASVRDALSRNIALSTVLKELFRV